MGDRRPVRVLHCAAGNLYGGVETFLRTLAELPGDGSALAHEFALCFEGQIAAELRARGAAVHRLGAVRFRHPWTAWRARRRLARVLADRAIDVVIGHGCWAYLLAGPVARRMGRPLVFWMHDLLTGTLPVERGAARYRPSLVLANSAGTAATLPRLFPGMTAEIVRYPVRPSPVKRSGVRAELATAADDVVIVNACRLERWKGHAVLLAALGRLRGRAGWTAWIAGGVQRLDDQPYLDELQSAAQAAGIEDRVRFLGHRSDVPRLLAAADIHCQPNTGPEPFGIAFVEALYAGLPVVSTRIGGAVEIVTDSCGVLVPPEDPKALAQALGSLIDDPSARACLGTNGPARARALCDSALVLGRLEECLLTVVQRSRIPDPALQA